MGQQRLDVGLVQYTSYRLGSENGNASHRDRYRQSEQEASIRTAEHCGYRDDNPEMNSGMMAEVCMPYLSRHLHMHQSPFEFGVIA
jgi:hypothetical protein